MVRTSSISMPSLVGLGHCMPPGGGAKKFRFLSVMLFNEKVCERHFAIKALEFGNNLGIVGQWNVCRCASKIFGTEF